MARRRFFYNSIRNNVQRKNIHQDPLGRWSAITYTRNNKSILFLTVYRIPDSSDVGPTRSCSQYNRILGSVHQAKHFREQLLTEIAEYVHDRNDIDNIVFCADLNQPLHHDRIKEFFLEIGIFDIFSTHCEIGLTERARTYVRGKNCIDIVAVTYNLLLYISKIKLLPFATVVQNDHLGFLWQFESDQYFQVKSYRLPKPRHLRLNPNCKTHKQEFVSKEEWLVDVLDLEDLLKILESQYVPEEVEFIDWTFTFIINKATSTAEGPLRMIPFSDIKLQAFEERQYWKKYIKLLNGSKIYKFHLYQHEENGDVCPIPTRVEKKYRVELAEIELCISSINVRKAITEANVNRDAFLLDLIREDVDVSKLKGNTKKKYLKTISNSERKKSTFKYLSEHIGKGENTALSTVIKYNKKDEVIKIGSDRHTVERMLIQYNTSHFKQAYHSTLYKDKIFPKLSDNKIQERILEGRVSPKECSSYDVYKFLSFLRTNIDEIHQRFKPITVDDFVSVVRKAKSRSTSSIFSERTYATYKCLICFPKLTALYVKFLNLVIQKKHVLNRWLDIVDVVLEKGKGPRLDKLRIIQLIEGDLQLLMRIIVTKRISVHAETTGRLSTSNYGNRRGYDINTAILEKKH